MLLPCLVSILVACGGKPIDIPDAVGNNSSGIGGVSSSSESPESSASVSSSVGVSSSLVASSSSALPVNQPPAINLSVVPSLKVSSQGVIEMNNRAISAIVTDSEGDLDRVELRIDNVLAGEPLTSAPFEWSERVFNGLGLGEHRVQVTAFDRSNTQSAEAVVTLVANALPQITFSGLRDQQVFEVGADIDIQIEASDVDGNIESVDVIFNGNSLGRKSLAPYSWLASDINELMSIDAAGEYTVNAIAVDDSGDESSTVLTFIVEDKDENPLTVGQVYAPNIFAPGLYGACYINAEQKAQCWGGNYLKNCNGKPEGEGNCVGRAVAPNNLGKVTALAGVHTGACAVLDTARYNGSNLRCWGPEVTQKIPGWSDAVSVVGGDRHACALRANGDVECWAMTHSSENSNSNWKGKFPAVPAGLKAKAISSNNNIACAIKPDDTFVCWNGPYNKSDVPNTPLDLKVKQVSTGGSNDIEDHVCVINKQDEVQCWAAAGDSNAAVKWYPQSVKVKSLSSGGAMSCAVKMNGDGICWGMNNNVTKVLGTDFDQVKVRGSGGNASRAFFVKSNGRIFTHQDFGKNKRKNLPADAKIYRY